MLCAGKGMLFHITGSTCIQQYGQHFVMTQVDVTKPQTHLNHDLQLFWKNVQKQNELGDELWFSYLPKNLRDEQAKLHFKKSIQIDCPFSISKNSLMANDIFYKFL